MATSIKLNDDLKARISKLSEQRKRSAHRILREAILQYVAREDREEARESFKQGPCVTLAERSGYCQLRHHPADRRQPTLS